jgi:hypothetical protein
MNESCRSHLRSGYTGIEIRNIAANEREIGYQLQVENTDCRKWRTGKSVFVFRLTPKPSL